MVLGAGSVRSLSQAAWYHHWGRGGVCGGLRQSTHGQALMDRLSGAVHPGVQVLPSPDTCEAVLSGGMGCQEDGKGSLTTSPPSHRQRSLCQPRSPQPRQDLQTGVPGSAAEGAHPPGSWVCRDSQAGRGGDATWGSEALRTVEEEE